MSRRNLQSNIMEIKRSRNMVETNHSAYLKNLKSNADSIKSISSRTGASGFNDIANLIESLEGPVKSIARGYDSFYEATEEQHKRVADRAGSAF